MCTGSSDDEELPVVELSANHSISSGCGMVMPNAAEIAAEREREARALQALHSLREQDGHVHAGSSRQDSSGSEGEAALAAAVRALRVHPAPPRAAPPPLLPALAPLAPPHLAPVIHRLATLLDRQHSARARAYLRQLTEALSCPSDSPDDMAWCTCVLCALAVAARPRVATLAALQAALARAPPPALTLAAHVLQQAAVQAAPNNPSSLLLRLADAVRGPSSGAATLHALLLRGAVTAALPHTLAEGSTAAHWLSAAASVGPAAQLTVLRAAGRLLAAQQHCAAQDSVAAEQSCTQDFVDIQEPPCVAQNLVATQDLVAAQSSSTEQDLLDAQSPPDTAQDAVAAEQSCAQDLVAALQTIARRRDNHPASFKVCVAAGQLRLLLVPDARAQ